MQNSWKLVGGVFFIVGVVGMTGAAHAYPIEAHLNTGCHERLTARDTDLKGNRSECFSRGSLTVLAEIHGSPNDQNEHYLRSTKAGISS